MSQESSSRSVGLSFRTDPETMGRINRLSRRLGVSKNDMVNILVAASLARMSYSQQAYDTDAIVASALSLLHEEDPT